MRRFHTLIFWMVATSLAATAQSQSPAPAQSSTDEKAAMDQRLRDLEDRIVMLEGEIRQLKAQGSQPAAGTTPAPGAQPTSTPETTAQQAAAPASQPDNVRLGGAGSAASKALNPDVSVIGDFIAGAGHNSINPTPSFQMHESEVGLQAIIDPYARGDFFLSFGEEGVNLEEGFITFTALPAGFVAKAGKIRAAFGKVNTLHNHVLPWADRPLVTQNLVGGEDGINDAGFSVQHIIPAPKNWFLEFTGQTFRGDSADVFTSSRKNDVSVVGHLRTYKDLSDSTNIDMGASYSRGHSLFGSDFVTHLYGVDATFRWKPLQRAIYHSFVARSEFIWRQQDQPNINLACGTIDCPAFVRSGFQRAFGFYASADYQFARRWFVGGRVDQSDRPFDASLTDKGGSFVLTYWPSEFAQVRGQYRFTRYAQNFDAHEAFIQLQFALGAHGAHPF
ncbi:MAG: TonB-dependent receptor [Acidobacteriia bacterium]|nr:TonB-dependent receptor [Terriglobia bacterium]